VSTTCQRGHSSLLLLAERIQLVSKSDQCVCVPLDLPFLRFADDKSIRRQASDCVYQVDQLNATVRSLRLSQRQFERKDVVRSATFLGLW